MDAGQSPTCDVTRFEVIDESGRTYVRTGVSVRVDYQDDGRTLKVFVKELPLDTAARARAEYGEDLVRSLLQALKEYRQRNPGISRHVALRRGLRVRGLPDHMDPAAG